MKIKHYYKLICIFSLINYSLSSLGKYDFILKLINNYFYFNTVANKDSEYGKSDKANNVSAQCGVPENCPDSFKHNISIESTTRIPLPGLTLVSLVKSVFGSVINSLLAICIIIFFVIVIVTIVRKKRKYKNHKPVNNVNDTPSTNI